MNLTANLCCSPISAGFKRVAEDFYEEHERPKQLYVWELVKNAARKLLQRQLPEALRIAIDPENAGLCGCWQSIAVWRERQKLREGKVVEEESEEYAYYATTLAYQEKTAKDLLQIIRGHQAACENGAHYRRDVTLGEDQSLISGRTEAFVMATHRNMVLGLFELQNTKKRQRLNFYPIGGIDPVSSFEADQAGLKLFEIGS